MMSSSSPSFTSSPSPSSTSPSCPPPPLPLSSSSADTLSVLEDHYYKLLEEYLSHFDHHDSAIVWLRYASPSSSFSLSVPRAFRSPKAIGGHGGYAEAFKRCGLSLRDKELKSGHFHLWHCDCKTVNLRALQSAIARRWKENKNFDEKKVLELLNTVQQNNKRVTPSSSSAAPPCVVMALPTHIPASPIAYPAPLSSTPSFPPFNAPSMVSMDAAFAFNTRMNANRMQVTQMLKKREEHRMMHTHTTPVMAYAANLSPIPPAAPIPSINIATHIPTPIAPITPIATINTPILPVGVNHRSSMMAYTTNTTTTTTTTNNNNNNNNNGESSMDWYYEKEIPYSKESSMDYSLTCGALPSNAFQKIDSLKAHNFTEKLNMAATSTHALKLSQAPIYSFHGNTKTPQPPPWSCVGVRPSTMLANHCAMVGSNRSYHGADEEVAQNLLSLAEGH